MDAPIGRRPELGSVDQRILDKAIAVETLDERHPRQVGGANTNRERITELRLHEGLLHIDEDVFARAIGIVAKIGGEVGGEDVVELVVDAEVKTLELGLRAVLDIVGGVARKIGRRLVDVADVEERLAGNFGVGEPTCLDRLLERRNRLLNACDLRLRSL